MLVLAWVAGLYLATQFFSEWEFSRLNPNLTPESQRTGEFIEVTLSGNAQGHFVAAGRINGERVTFLLDTGATDVAVPARLAEQLGLSRGQPQPVMTASGPSTGYRTRIERLELGDIVLNGVPALLIPDFDSPVVLLGMSALKQLEFTQRAGTMLLRQHVTEQP
ncbi:retropepsin-like aspartic protease family protein [Stutzerimonas tarimensis]|uniref:TIGR02281 family clan AA aspartic protease n=1 Tax=Stutzerimonas tarimensis TaxID=1507735 RepID=A0ABV7T7W3_9GAMM